MNYGGTIRDKQTFRPIPRATVESWNNGRLIHRTIANDAGSFTISAFIPATVIRVSSVGYQTTDFPADPGKMLYELEKNIITLPPVVVSDKNKSGLLWIAALLGLAILVNEKK